MKVLMTSVAMLLNLGIVAQDTSQVKQVSVQPDSNYAMLYVYRPRNFVGAGISYNLHMGDSVLCRVKNNSKYAIKLTGMGLTEFWAGNEQRITFKINVKPGKKYYIKCSVKTGLFAGRAELNMVPEEVGEIEYEAVEGRKAGD